MEGRWQDCGLEKPKGEKHATSSAEERENQSHHGHCLRGAVQRVDAAALTEQSSSPS